MHGLLGTNNQIHLCSAYIFLIDYPMQLQHLHVKHMPPLHTQKWKIKT